MVNRRGSLEWNLETIGKLFIGAVVLIFIFTLTIAIFNIFNQQEDIQARKNFDMLVSRIEQVHNADLKGSEASLLFTLPKKYTIVGYDGVSTRSMFSDVDCTYDSGTMVWMYSRPVACSDKTACLCMYKSQEDNDAALIQCENIPYKRISSSIKTVYLLVEEHSRWIHPISGNTICTFNLRPKQNELYPLLLTANSCGSEDCGSLADIKFEAANEELVAKWNSTAVLTSCTARDAQNKVWSGTCSKSCIKGTLDKGPGTCANSKCCVDTTIKSAETLKSCEVKYEYKDDAGVNTVWSLTGYCDAAQCANPAFQKDILFSNMGSTDVCKPNVCCVGWSCKAQDAKGVAKEGFCKQGNSCGTTTPSIGKLWTAYGKGDCEQGYVCCSLENKPSP